VADKIKKFDHNEQKTWDSLEIYYDPSLLESACHHLYDAYEELSGSNAYEFDLVDVTRQVLANIARGLHLKLMNAFATKDIDTYDLVASQFLELIQTQDELLNTREEFMFGPWLEQAK